MALYYDVPGDLEKLIQATKDAAANHNTMEWKEGVAIKWYHDTMKIVIDGEIGRDYSELHTVFERILFDPKAPEKWETLVKALIDKYR